MTKLRRDLVTGGNLYCASMDLLNTLPSGEPFVAGGRSVRSLVDEPLPLDVINKPGIRGTTSAGPAHGLLRLNPVRHSVDSRGAPFSSALSRLP